MIMWRSRTRVSRPARRTKSLLLVRKENDIQNLGQFNENGQFYMEISTRAPQSQDANWIELSEIDAAKFEVAIGVQTGEKTLREAEAYAAYLKKEDKSWPNTGMRKLADAAVTTAVQNIREIQPWMLEDVKSSKALIAIWREINRNCVSNLVTWQAFSKLLIRQIDTETGKISSYTMATLDLYRYENQIRSPVLPLLDYVTPLISPTFDFISILTIKQNVPLVQLVQLKKLRNLGVLHLMGTGPNEISCVNDRLLRAWSEAVVTEGAFLVLRVLNIWGHSDITFRSLQHVSKFPALALFDIRQSLNFGTQEDVQLHARKYAWAFKIVAESSDDDHAQLLAAWRSRYGRNPPGGERKIERYFKERREWDEARVVRSWENRTPMDAVNLLSFHQHTARAKAHKNVWLYMGRKADEEWQMNLHPLFTLIGNMRNDSDLKKAGVQLDHSQSLFALDWPVPPIPTVSLHLGSGSSGDAPLRPPTTGRPDIIFTRLSQPQVSEASSISTSNGNLASSKNPVDMHTSAKSRSRPEPKNVRASKRMKLDSVLGSLLS